ncbi:MAG: AsmA-like C-terminal region-containing protein [Methylotenera sp.]
MDLSVIYSKTAKGLRARSSLIGGLSSNLMKILSYIDGKSKAEAILAKFDLLTEKELASALTQLENEGYIRPVTVTYAADDWAPTTNFAPMVVEEFQSEEEIEARVRAEAEEEVRLEAEREAREEEEAKRIRAELKAQEKARAEAKVNARLEIERVAREAEEARKKAEAEARAKAAEEGRLEAERKAKAEEKARLEAERIAREAKAEAEQTRAKAAEEARLEAECKAKAEEKARLEAERIAREAKAEARARIEAEENARREIERIAREAEKAEEEARQEAKRKAKAEEQARLEKERIARETEEARKKSKAEARAKAKEEARLEAERKAKVKEEARLQAELKAREEAEQIRIKTEAKEKADAEAKEAARLELERIVRKAEEDRKKSEAKAKEARLEAKRKAKAEEEARLKAERKAREEAELIRARAEAEEKARVEAKEKVRLEMERISREAEEERKKSKIEANTKAEEAVLEVERKAKMEESALLMVKAETQGRVEKDARFEAEHVAPQAEVTQNKFEYDDERALSEEDLRELAEEEEEYEAKRMAKAEAEDVTPETEEKARQEAEEQAREEVKRIAREDAASKARLKAEAKIQAMLLAIATSAKKWIKVTMKAALIGLPLLALLLIGLLPFISLGMLVEPIEKLAAESVGEPVTVKEVHASLWPVPHLVIGDVTIGTKPGQKIEAVNVLPVTSTLFEEVKMVKSLEIEGLNVEQENFGQPLRWINSSGKAEHLKIEQISLKNLKLKIHDLELGPFEGKIGLTESRELKNIDLSSADHALSIQISPQGGSFDVMLTASNWPLPANPKLVFDELSARGTANQDRINFSQIDGKIYGGNITAKSFIDWSNQWTASGNFEMFKVSSSQMLKAFDSVASIDGKLDLKGNFTSKSPEAAKLAEASHVTANFELRDGKINDTDLARAVLYRGNQSLSGDATHFDKLAGSVQFENGRYQYRKLVLASAQFHARGNMDILPNQDISGKISADLAAQSRRLQASFGLAGKVGDVRKQ